MAESLAKTTKQSGWAHSSHPRGSSVSEDPRSEACFLLVKRSGKRFAYRTRENALTARSAKTDVVVEVLEGDELP